MSHKKWRARITASCLTTALGACSLSPAPVARQTPVADEIIRGGMIYTGSTDAPFIGDVAFKGDRIIYVGTKAPMPAMHITDATGMIVAPGFIDAHTHPDTFIRSSDPHQRLNAPWLYQGVSTVVIGVDGYGTYAVREDAMKLERSGIGTNVLPFVGFGTVRGKVIGEAARAPTAEELEQEKTLVTNAMCEGARGFSTGLFYAPQSFAKTDEVIALAREAAKRGGDV